MEQVSGYTFVVNPWQHAIAHSMNVLNCFVSFPELCGHSIPTLLIHYEHVHVLRQETTGVANVNGSLLLISCQYPDLDICLDFLKINHMITHLMRNFMIPCFVLLYLTLAKLAMVSGTPSWSLSSIAVAPIKLKFCSILL